MVNNILHDINLYPSYLQHRGDLDCYQPHILADESIYLQLFIHHLRTLDDSFLELVTRALGSLRYNYNKALSAEAIKEDPWFGDFIPPPWRPTVQDIKAELKRIQLSSLKPTAEPRRGFQFSDFEIAMYWSRLTSPEYGKQDSRTFSLFWKLITDDEYIAWEEERQQQQQQDPVLDADNIQVDTSPDAFAIAMLAIIRAQEEGIVPPHSYRCTPAPSSATCTQSPPCNQCSERDGRGMPPWNSDSDAPSPSFLSERGLIPPAFFMDHRDGAPLPPWRQGQVPARSGRQGGPRERRERLVVKGMGM
ncbi:MAG: hypothetical protein Q9222_003074 [Ikaeria aurantiellina]